jgi:Uma2 family endonuclease
MHDSMIPLQAPRIPLYDGVRATADEYFALPDDSFQYELIDGVMLTSPSPMPLHQRIAAEIFFQLELFLRSNPVGLVFPETDVRLTQKLVYRPEMVFVRRENLARVAPRIDFPPRI